MSFNKKLSEAGWFYHAPAKRQGPQEPVGAPPPSQIPGLAGDVGVLPEEPQRMWIKDTDSAYVQLAKRGGREDLLRMRTPKAKSKEPKGYPRVDWFYQDDIVAEDANNNNGPSEPYEFLLPDYMVHQGVERSEAGYKPNRLPYAADKTTCYERDDNNPTDKTVKLPEVRAHGYGVRQEKSGHSSGKPHQPVPRTQPCKPTSPQLGPATHKVKPMPVANDDGRACMGKILSFGYLDDWQKDRERWEEKQRKLQEGSSQTSKPEKIHSEYQDAMTDKGLAKSKPPLKPISRGTSAGSAGVKNKPENIEEKPEIFKLSKFKNVAARTDSHRRQKADPALPGPAVHMQAVAN